MMDTSTAGTEPGNISIENCEKSNVRTNSPPESVNKENDLQINSNSNSGESNSRTRTKNESDSSNGVCNVNKKENGATSLGNGDSEEEAVNIKISQEEFSQLSPSEVWEKWQWCVKRITNLEAKLNATGDEEALKNQISELQRKETYHIMRLTAKETELQEMLTGVTASKSLPINRGSLLDPAVNLCIERLKRELEMARTKMEEAQNELAAWKFTPDSNTGKQLMAKCRSLIKENEELGRVISSGKLAKLEGDIALQRNFTEELKKSQSELDEFLLEMDEDTEGMQGTIVYLQDQLRAAKQELHQLKLANSETEEKEVKEEICEKEAVCEAVEQTVANDLSCSADINTSVVNNNDTLRTAVDEKAMLDSIESMIIPKKEFDSVSGNISVSKRTFESGDDNATEGIEPPCKKSKAHVLGEEEGAEGDALGNGD